MLLNEQKQLDRQKYIFTPANNGITSNSPCEEILNYTLMNLKGMENQTGCEKGYICHRGEIIHMISL